MKAANPFDLPEGGIDDIDLTITDAAFVFDDNFTDDDGNPICLLSLTLDGEDGEHDEFTKFYGCGPGWEPADGGKRAVKSDDPDSTKPFNGGTKVGRLIKAMTKTEAAEVILARYADGEGIGATDAAMFVGLRFHWKNEVKGYRFKRDGQVFEGESVLLLPTEFLGETGGTAKKSPAKKAGAKKPAKKAAAKKAEPVEEPEESGPTGPLEDEKFMAAAAAAFDAAEDFDGWLEAMLEVDGVEAYHDFTAAPTDGLWDHLCALAEEG